MGNYCCPNKDEKDVGKKPNKNKEDSVAAPVDFEFNLNGIQIIVKVGDITKEVADAIVSGTDNYARNRSTSFLTPQMTDSLNKAVAEKRGPASQEPLLNGEVIITGPGNFRNVQNVIHMSVPLWRGGKHKEVEILKQGFSRILDEATKTNIKSIIFTDIAASLFGIPKQHSAKTLMQAIHEYADNFNSPNKIQTIKFIHKERQTVLIFEDFLKQEVGIRSDRVQSEYTDNLQGSKLFDDQIPNEVQKENLEMTSSKGKQPRVDAETKQSINASSSQ